MGARNSEELDMGYEPFTGGGRAPDGANLPDPGDSGGDLADLIAAVRDSAAGLDRGAELVEGEEAGVLADLAERRRSAAATLATAIADVAPTQAVATSGDLIETLRRGWMEVEGALAAGDDVIATATAQDRRVAELLGAATDHGLPADIEAVVRRTHLEVLDAIERLEELLD
ncbi:MAG: hypothetical protein AB1Z55_07970 [Acidimicrobiia bacterium]